MALAISGVSGTLTDGQTLTITGTDFGSHADYGSTYGLCYAWNDIETALDHDGFVTHHSGEDNIHWSRETTGTRTGSSYWGKRFAQETEEGATSNMAGMFKPDTTASSYSDLAFVSFWYRVTATTTSGKFYRQFGGNGDAATSVFWAATGLCGETYNFGFRGDDDLGNGPAGTSENVFSTSSWQRVDFLQSAANIKAWIVGTNSNNPHWNWNTGQARNNYFQAVIGAGKDGDGGTDYYGYDDIYIDFTQARVEIADTDTWSSRTTSEIQIPTAWGATEIQVTLNQGGFDSLSGKYLYVIDSSGNVSGGYLLGEGATSKRTLFRK